MSAPLVLVVDDDAHVREWLARELRAGGYRVSTAIDGRSAEVAAAAEPVSLVLTDLAMPGADGFTLIEALRRGSDVPIVVLSVRSRDDDKVRALDLGADDYVTKPFSVAELLARVRAHLRRTDAAGQSVLRFPDLVVDLERREVVQGGRKVHLTPTEMTLLELLARNAGKPLTFRQIVARAWKTTAGTTNDTVRVHVGALRRKLEPDPSNPRYIVTEPWVGYRFIAERI